VHTYNIDQGGEQAPTADTTNIIPIASKKPIADGIAGAMSEALITEIDAAVKAMNKAEKWRRPRRRHSFRDRKKLACCCCAGENLIRKKLGT